MLLEQINKKKGKKKYLVPSTFQSIYECLLRYTYNFSDEMDTLLELNKKQVERFMTKETEKIDYSNFSEPQDPPLRYMWGHIFSLLGLTCLELRQMDDALEYFKVCPP